MDITVTDLPNTTSKLVVTIDVITGDTSVLEPSSGFPENPESPKNPEETSKERFIPLTPGTTKESLGTTKESTETSKEIKKMPKIPKSKARKAKVSDELQNVEF